MGELISGTADIDRIAEHVAEAHRKGTARGGDIAAACKDRLDASVLAVEKATELRSAAIKAEEAAWAIVLAADHEADGAIAAVRDEMWNALGRPRQSPFIDEVFPGGMGTYTSGDPRGQPVLMQILHSRILAAAAPQWSDQKRIGWAATIESVRVPYAAAVDGHRPTEAAVTVAEAGYRAAVRGAHARLKNLKRDLKSLGLTEAQVHEIIPDDGAGSPKKPADK